MAKNREKKWNISYTATAESDALIRRMAQETDLSEVMARLLYIRGYQSSEAAMRFLRMEETSLHDPFLMKDVAKGVERVEIALEKHEKIAIYGDYDVDGVTAVSLIYLYLRSKGADVGYYIPSRSLEGYGLSNQAIDRLHEQGVRLILTVDTGITATEEAAYAASLGIDMVITDHHECRAELPDACAVINPHRPDDSYPFAELAGVGVVFKFVCALEMSVCRRAGIPEIDGVRRVCWEYSDLAAIGTVADVMTVADENRLIISMGLHRMETDCRLGLRALADAASFGKEKANGKPKKITSSFIGFTIAPRMNAAGRVSRASIAVELLLAEDHERAEALAEELCRLNTERQIEENRISEEAYKKIEALSDEEKRCVLVLDDDTWHPGIIGIVSSRITERYGLPSVLISYEGAMEGTASPMDVGKGSGRSLKGLNLVNALSACEDLLVRYGGHELAAGLSIRRSDVSVFRKRINEYASEQLGGEPICHTLDADCELQMSDLTMKLAQELDYLEPFGISNPVPCFVLKDVHVLRIVPMGGGKHLRLTVEKDGVTVNAVWFGMSVADLGFEPTDTVDLMFRLNINEFQNTTSLQLILQDARISESEVLRLSEDAKRFEEIHAGAAYRRDEDVLPERGDVASVYTFLRREFRAGHTSFPMRRLLGQIRSAEGKAYNYIKMKFIIRILQELQICGVSEPITDHFLFDIYPVAKTDLERSELLHRLREQQR
ncbi:MAG: single-stranded-DNA-specific exonuclease RecJ [Clostridia bacterium]|nr:single-stranded-DNA-specific exonuclease RecJ [Clostridia bacterium]